MVGLGIPEASTVATTWKPHDLCVIRLEMTFFSTQALRLLLSAHLNRSRPPRTAPQPRGRLHLEKKKNYRRRKTWVVQHRNDFMNPGFFVAFAMICLFACISTGKYVMKFNCGFCTTTTMSSFRCLYSSTLTKVTFGVLRLDFS